MSPMEKMVGGTKQQLKLARKLIFSKWQEGH